MVDEFVKCLTIHHAQKQRFLLYHEENDDVREYKRQHFLERGYVVLDFASNRRPSRLGGRLELRSDNFLPNSTQKNLQFYLMVLSILSPIKFHRRRNMACLLCHRFQNIAPENSSGSNLNDNSAITPKRTNDDVNHSNRVIDDVS